MKTRHAASRVKHLWDGKLRAIVLQAALIAILLLLVITAGYNYYRNISYRNIGIGFGFLQNTAGFSISQTLIPFTEADTFGRTFVVGLLNTLLASVLSILFATVLGFVFGLSLLSRNTLLRQSAQRYVDLLRNIPPLLHVLFWYQVVFLNALPQFKDSINIADAVFINVRGITFPELVRQPGASAFSMLVVSVVLLLIIIARAKQRLVLRGDHRRLWPYQLALAAVIILAVPLLRPYDVVLPEMTRFKFSRGSTIRPELFSVVCALSTYTSTYIAEIVKNSVLSVPKGQVEAAKSLGLSSYLRLRLVIVPQAMRTMIPPMTNQYLNIIKNTSLGMAVAYPDLTSVFAGTTLNQTGRALEVMIMVMLTYLSISLFTSVVMNWYNHRIINRTGDLLSEDEIEEMSHA